MAKLAPLWFPALHGHRCSKITIKHFSSRLRIALLLIPRVGTIPFDYRSCVTAIVSVFGAFNCYLPSPPTATLRLFLLMHHATDCAINKRRRTTTTQRTVAIAQVGMGKRKSAVPTWSEMNCMSPIVASDATDSSYVP